jgi:hypothetical protein
VSSAELPADNNEKQEHSYRGCSGGGFCTARAVLAYIFGMTFAEARTLRGAAEPRRLLGGNWREPSRYGLRISRRLVVREARLSMALVKHSKGDLLIDTGFGRNIDEQFRTLP